MRFVAILLVSLTPFLPNAAAAQSDETLADIRQQLSVLYVDIQNLRRELSTTGSPQVATGGGTTLERIDAIESELRRLTGRTEQLENRIVRIVEDGTNRIGDLEFRLVELEGGDVSELGEMTTLGGDEPSVPSLSDGSLESGTIDSGNTELAVGESADYERALAALNAEDFSNAANQFSAFLETYPGSPLSPQAHLGYGKALEGQDPQTNDQRAVIARAYLDSYSGDMTGPVADEALYRLGKALGALGKINEACVTLGEVHARHPGSDMVMLAQSEMRNLGCDR